MGNVRLEKQVNNKTTFIHLIRPSASLFVKDFFKIKLPTYLLLFFVYVDCSLNHLIVL